jgi:hypothetical protein
MGLFEAIRKNDYKWAWFILTFIASVSPIICRVIISIDFKINLFDIRDLLFAGLALNLSNFNLVGSKKFDDKILIVLSSIIFITCFAFIIGVVLASEAIKNPPAHTFLDWLSVIVAILSVYVSFEANNYVFKTVPLT